MMRAKRPRSGCPGQQHAARGPCTPPKLPQSASAVPNTARAAASTLHGRRSGARRRRSNSAGACDGAAKDAGKSWATRARGPSSTVAAAAASGGANGHTCGLACAHARIFARAAHLASATAAGDREGSGGADDDGDHISPFTGSFCVPPRRYQHSV